MLQANGEGQYLHGTCWFGNRNYPMLVCKSQLPLNLQFNISFITPTHPTPIKPVVCGVCPLLLFFLLFQVRPLHCLKRNKLSACLSVPKMTGRRRLNECWSGKVVLVLRHYAMTRTIWWSGTFLSRL